MLVLPKDHWMAHLLVVMWESRLGDLWADSKALQSVDLKAHLLEPKTVEM